MAFESPWLRGGSVENRVIPAKAGIHRSGPPALAGATPFGILISLGGPRAHDRSGGATGE